MSTDTEESPAPREEPPAFAKLVAADYVTAVVVTILCVAAVVAGARLLAR